MQTHSARLWRWIGAAFFSLAAIVLFPSWCTLFGLVAAALLLPPLQAYWSNSVNRSLRICAVILCALLTFVSLPSRVGETDNAGISIPLETAQQEEIKQSESAFTQQAMTDELRIEPVAISGAHKSAESSFTVHYIDVGQGDAALVCCDGHAMLIDGGTPSNSSLIVSYLKKQHVTRLDCIVSTHAHEDHVGGLSGALNKYRVGTVYASVTEYDSSAFRSFQKYTKKQGLQIKRLKAGDSFTLGSSNIAVLAPIRAYADHNDESIVLKITYGRTSFLFTGDANNDAEHDLRNAGTDLRATVLKVGHHGSDDATSYVFLREVMPKYAIISCGKDNSYGHPTDAVLSRLRDAGATIFRTDLQGDIVCSSDGNTITFKTEKQADHDSLLLSGDALTNQNNRKDTNGVTRQTEPSESESGGYIGNKNSHKFHRSSCNSLPKAKNRVYFSDREGAVAAGYVPCKRCKP